MKLSEIWTLTDKDKTLITSFIAKGKTEQEHNEKFSIIDFPNFYKLFNTEEISLMKKYLAIDPKSIDYKLPFIGYEDTPSDLVAIPNQLQIQYLPKRTFDAYTKMNEAMFAAINKKLFVLYGYRSPARQVFMFFDILERIYNFDLDKTVRRVCFLDYSEHVCTKKQAIDVTTVEGGRSEDFDKTDEYKWLQKNAAKFGFYESYQRDINVDMMYEPWHWHLE